MISFECRAIKADALLWALYGFAQVGLLLRKGNRMELKELLDLHEKLESRINSYWTYWSVAIFAMGGWLFSGKQCLSQSQSMGISIAAMVFFFSNLAVLWPATRLATAVRDEIRLKAKDIAFQSVKLTEAFAEDSLVFRLQLTVVLHLVVDGVVLWALLAANVCK